MGTLIIDWLGREGGVVLRLGDVAAPLGRVQNAFPDVAMGSYPGFEEGVGFTTTLVLRSRDEARLGLAEEKVKAMVAELEAAGAN